MRASRTRLLTAGATAAFAVAFGQPAQALEFDQNVTNNVIFGSGNANGGFTTDRANGIELGLRGKLRFDANSQPQNIFNNTNTDNTYSFAPGASPNPAASSASWDNSTTTPIWNVDFSVNSNFDGNGGNLSSFVYEWGLDFDPSLGTSFLTFDPVRDLPDNAFGNNGTDETNNAVGAFAAFGGSNNLAQNSQNYEFYNVGQFASFDPFLDGTYTIYLEAKDQAGALLARTEIDIIVGVGGTAVPEPASLLLLGAGLVGLGVARRRRA